MVNLRSVSPWRMREGRPPIPGESLSGYLAHRAAEERLPTLLIVTSLADVRYGHRSEAIHDAEDIAQIADCVGVGVHDLRSLGFPLQENGRRRVFDVPVDRVHVDLLTRRFSPSSLIRSAHHRAAWCLRALPFCEESWEYLIDRCPSPSCGCVQRWHRTNGIDRCDRCGGPLTVASVETVPEDIRPALSMLGGLVHHDDRRRSHSLDALPDELRVIGVGPVFDLAVAIAGFVDPRIRGRRHRRMLRPDAGASDVCRAMASAWDLLSGWPDAFQAEAASRLARRRGRFGDGNDGATLDLLALGHLRSMPTGVERLLSDISVRLGSNRGDGYDCREAARATGLPVSRIAELRRDGVIDTVFHLQADRPQPLLCRMTVDRLATLIRTSVPITAAAVRLGVTHHGVEQLVCGGDLTLLQNVTSRQGVTARIDDASLRAFVDRIEARPRRLCGLTIGLREALAGTRGQKAWGPILRALADGRVPFDLADGERSLTERITTDVRGAAALRQLRFYRADHPSFVFAETMSKKDAMQALNLHLRHAVPLLASWPSTLKADDAVPVDAVEKLCAAFVSPAELASMLGRTAKAASVEAELVGLRRISPAGYDRAEVDDWRSGCTVVETHDWLAAKSGNGSGIIST